MDGLAATAGRAARRPVARRCAAAHRHADDVRPRRGRGARHPARRERIPAQRRRARAAARRPPHGACRSSVIAASATRDLFAHFAGPAPAEVPAAYGELTEREREIFALAARGLSNAEIAQREYLSEATVKTHISRILGKLAPAFSVQLVVFAFEHVFA